MLHTDTSQHQQRSIQNPTSEGLGHGIDDRMDSVPVRLSTVPIVLKCGSKWVKINALLDDASSRSYMNVSIVEELWLSGHQCTVRVGVLNDTGVNIDTNHIEVGLERVTVDGTLDMGLKAGCCGQGYRWYECHWQELPFKQVKSLEDNFVPYSCTSTTHWYVDRFRF